MAAVLATFAATQESAVTLTVLHTDVQAVPVAGSKM
jgi:hypothetical protein